MKKKSIIKKAYMLLLSTIIDGKRIDVANYYNIEDVKQANELSKEFMQTPFFFDDANHKIEVTASRNTVLRHFIIWFL